MIAISDDPHDIEPARAEIADRKADLSRCGIGLRLVGIDSDAQGSGLCHRSHARRSQGRGEQEGVVLVHREVPDHVPCPQRNCVKIAVATEETAWPSDALPVAVAVFTTRRRDTSAAVKV